MMTTLRRALVTALLGALVGLGVLKALFGRHHQTGGAASVGDLAPAALPMRRERKAKAGRGAAVGLAALLVTGLAGILYENRETLTGTGPRPTDGKGAPLAALSDPPAGARPAPPMPRVDASAGAAPSTGTDGGAGTREPGRPAPTAPRFDVVRVAPSGEAVVAGQAAPDATVEVLVDGKPAATARTGADGHFIATLPSLPTGSSAVGVGATDAGGDARRSSETVAVVVAPSRDARPLVAVTSPDSPIVVLSQPDQQEDHPAETHSATLPAPARQALLGDGEAPAEAPAKPDMPSRGRDTTDAGTDLGAKPEEGRGRSADGGCPTGGVQAGASGRASPEQAGPAPGRAGGAAPSVDSSRAAVRPSHHADEPAAGAPAAPKVVSIDTGNDGQLFVSARAAPGASMRLYLNRTLIAPATVGPDGTVTFAVGHGVRPGAYEVRLDLIDPATGKVRNRAEVRFTAPASDDDGAGSATARQDSTPEPVAPDLSARREAASPPQPSSTGSVARSVPPAAGAGSSEVFVPAVETARIVRGDSLWRISRRTYGEGDRYTLIFDANRDQIRDPDLIYPGQVFVLPVEGANTVGREGAP